MEQIEKEMVSSEEVGEDGGILLDDNEERPRLRLDSFHAVQCRGH